MKRNGCVLLLLLFLLTGRLCACAEPDLTLLDPSPRSGSWPEVYAQLLTEHSAGIQAYQDYVAEVTYSPVCRPVGFIDLTGDGIPELLFTDLTWNQDYGFQVGRLWIYTSDGDEVRCMLTLVPEIDDLLYSRYYLAEDGLLTVYLSDCEMSWILRLRPDAEGPYAAETVLTEQADFSGEGPDFYYLNGATVSPEQYRSLEEQVRAGRGEMIGSLNVEEEGYGFTYTLAEALEALPSLAGTFLQSSSIPAG